ncbi:Cyclic nucleotide-gated ion channel 2-like protein [Drosera capensis]
MLSISLPNFSLLRWVSGWISVKRRGAISDSTVSDSAVGSSRNEEDGQGSGSFSSPNECYACTQVGIPVFHSTSCDQASQPEWEAYAGSYLFPVQARPRQFRRKGKGTGRGGSGIFGPVLDPRSDRVKRWNRAILIARGMALAVDPLFFYALSIGRHGSGCVYVDTWLAGVVTVLRTCVDGVHLFHLWLQFRLAYVSRESLVVGCGKLVWDTRAIASHYVRSLKGFWADLFVILPIPQAVFWCLVPRLIADEKIKQLLTILLLSFLFQFLPKVYHSISLMRRMQKVTGYIFGTIWWNFCLNLIAYFIASHVVGGWWYVLAIQRVSSCLTQQCQRDVNCNLSLACSAACRQSPLPVNGTGTSCGIGGKSLCLDDAGPYNFGIYVSALPVISSKAFVIKILYPISWGLFQLSTFGNNLTPTCHWSEVLFGICLVLGGLMLFTLLIGNIQVFLHTVMANKRKLQVRCRDMEWWMRRRQLPSRLRHRVRQFERQSWVTTGGLNEMDLVKDLPEGLRRDIKRYLCLDLIKKVPLFHCLDDLILDNICDRVKPLIYSKDEKIMREGDPVQRMIFIVRGRIRSSQSLSKGIVATSIVEPGGFMGDELISWSLRRPFMHRLPASSATFVCLESTEAFGLDAYDLRYITEHFRYKFANESLKRTLRYHSSNWRTWGAVNIQLAWRRYMRRTRRSVGQIIENGDTESDRLRHFAAMFMSLRPHDHLD